MNTSASAGLAPSPFAAIGWAFYVAVSWTWVIGMFLPVLLVRDFGLLGWAAFAVPNIVGAASVGWLMKSPRQSAEFVLRHRPAVTAFSAITISFQITIYFWLLGSLFPVFTDAWQIFIPTAIVLLLSGPLGTLLPVKFGRERIIAAAVWLASAAALIALLIFGWLERPAVEAVEPLNLGGLALSCGLGFLLCPYLDVTFHAARQAAGDRSRLAFAVGFFVLFPVMIGFTLLYAIGLPGLMRGQFDDRVNGLATLLLMIHLTLQVLATNYFHATALRRLDAATGRQANVLASGGFWLAALIVWAFVGWLMSRQVFVYNDLLPYSGGEMLYRGFLTFYGLIFPAYLLLGRRWMWLGVIATAPLFALGFFGGPYEWSMGWAGLGVIALLAIWFVTKPTRQPQAPLPPNDGR